MKKLRALLEKKRRGPTAKAKRAVRRVQRDPRFFKYLCELKSGVVIAPFGLVAVLPLIWGNAGFRTIEGFSAALRIAVVAVSLVSAIFEISFCRARFEKFRRALQRKITTAVVTASD